MERLTIAAFVLTMFFSSTGLNDPKKRTMSFEESRHIADSTMRAIAGDSIFAKCFFLDSFLSVALCTIPGQRNAVNHLRYSNGYLSDSLPEEFQWTYTIRSAAVPEFEDAAEIHHTPFGKIDVYYRKIPECMGLPNGCDYIDSSEAKALAFKAGMPKGLDDLNVYFSFFDGRFVWSMETTLSDSSTNDWLKYTTVVWEVDAISKEVTAGQSSSFSGRRPRD